MTAGGSRLRIFTLVLAALAPAHAEVRRALLVGIDDYIAPDKGQVYQPSERNRQRLKSIHGAPSRQILAKLDGAFNDATAMKEILIQRFGFEDRNVIVLPNPEQPATADNILQLLQSHLIDQAKPGDVSFFYYAGHGSRIKNRATQNENTSGMDSTIIPADALLGVPDIRSKELARIYAQAPKKGVTLTVILDSCYSGGSFRGISSRKIRAQSADTGVWVDEKFEGPLPEDEGVLIISASQDYEPAAELPQTDLGAAHGAFTWALLHVLGGSPPNESVGRIFQRTRALIQSSVSFQEPVLLAKKGRSQRGLFGEPSTGRRFTVAASRVSGKIIKMNGGLAMNLREGCELKRIAPAGPSVELRIARVTGLASSDAILTRQTQEPALVHPGDLFELTKWVAPEQEQLRLYVPPAAPRTEIERAMTAFAGLHNRVDWITDPTGQSITHILSWDGSRAKWSWKENNADAQPVWLEQLSSKEVLSLAAKAEPRPRVLLWIPPSADLSDQLRFDGNLAPASSPALADYALVGRLCASGQSSCTEYAWVRSNIYSRGQTGDVPLRTDWVLADNNGIQTSRALTNAALGLARIFVWSRLRSPDAATSWPYHLALRRERTNEIIDSGNVQAGERYKLLLRAAASDLSADVRVRRVYVFVIDSFGKATLLFGSNLENEFPRLDAAETALPEKVSLTNRDWDFEIGEPYGVDNYFLLSSATPIDNPETVFDFAAVRTRGVTETPTNPLASFLRNAARGMRGSAGTVPVTWSIEHLTLTSRPAGGAK